MSLSNKEREDLEFLSKGQINFLEGIEELNYFSSPDQLNTILEDWKQQGVKIDRVGQSLSGEPIFAAVFEPDGIYLDENKTKTVLAWGYPHPDEPLGAEALVLLGEAMLSDRANDLELRHLRFVLILCGDPDNASRQLWHGDKMQEKYGEQRLPDSAEYYFGVWRPTHLGLEIDYGFPLDWGPFNQPKDYLGACHSIVECTSGCSRLGKCAHAEEPFGPLPESLALVTAMEKYKPELVFSMHSNHSGGDYTFLFKRESKLLMNQLIKIPEIFSYRHLGEPLDRGHRWSQSIPDLFRERDLGYRKKSLERLDRYEEGARYLGNASAVNWIEANLPGTQFVCPEATLFRTEDYANENIIDQKIDIQVLRTKNNKGSLVDKYYYQDSYIAQKKVEDDTIQMPALNDDISEFQDHAASTQRSTNFRSEVIVLPKALLGVQALERRRFVMDMIDKLWIGLNEEIDFHKYAALHHPFRDERDAITVPGKFIGDQSMLIFRTREDYMKPSTIAAAATFRYFWSAQTSFVVGNFNNYLQYILASAEELKITTNDLYIIEDYQRKLLTLQQTELIKLPEDLQNIQTAPAIKSILGRLFVFINAL